MNNKNNNKQSQVIYDPMIDPNLPEYGFGSWLKKNAGTIGSVVGAGVGTLIAPGVGTSIGASLGGQVGGSVQTSDAQKTANQQAQEQATIQAGEQQSAAYQQNNTQPQYAPTLANGGFIDYNGQSHQGKDGGIPIDKNGNPSKVSGQPTVALTEDKEVNWLRPDGQSYIFSDKLGYAKDAKKLMNKYKKKLGKDFDRVDSMGREAMEAEFNNLLEKQETTRAEKGLNRSRSMDLPAFDGGGFTGLTEEQLMFDASKINPIQNNGAIFNPIANPYTDSGLADMTKINIGGQTVNRSDLTPETIGLNSDAINAKFERGLNRDAANDGNYAPQLSPAANIVNALGNTADYFIAKGNKSEDVKLGRVSPQEIDLGRSRDIARRDAETSRNISARNIRNLSGSKGQALSNLGASQNLSQRTLGDITSRSIEAEELANAKARQQADSQNAQFSSQEAQINAQLQNNYQDKLNKLNPLRSALQQTGQYLTDAEKNRRLYSLAQMYNPNMRINKDENVTDWQRFLGNRGFTTNYRD